MTPLNLPEYPFNVHQVGETRYIFDSIRRKYVALTPEEWVRQNFIQFLIQERHCPRGLIAVEAGYVYNGMPRRADVVVYGRKGEPVLVGECKAPEIELGQAAFDQIARYNTVIGARHLVVTNGLVHYCCEVDLEGRSYRFLDDLPEYDLLILK